MTDRLEHSLTRTLEAAAESAPGPAVDFLDTVRRRQRRRRTRRGLTVASAVLALCLAGTLTVVAHLSPVHRSGPATTNPTASPSAPAHGVPAPRIAQPAGRVWPSAVHALPPNLPDGSAYRVNAVLGGDRYLVTILPPGTAGVAESVAIDSATGVDVFDAAAHTVRTIATVPPPTGGAMAGPDIPRTGLRSWPLVDGDVVTWADTATTATGTARHESYTEIWAASVATGRAVLLTRVPVAQADVGVPRPAGTMVVWTQYATDKQHAPVGIYRVPAAGGTPAQVPGTAGYDLVAGAWAQPAGQLVDGRTDQLLNVLTGRRMTVPVGGDEHDRRLECGPAWCAGAGAERISFAVVPADGSPGPTELDRPYGLFDGGRVALAAGSDSHGNPQGVIVWNPGSGLWGELGAGYALPDPATADVSVLQAQSRPGAPVEVFDLSVASRRT